MKKVSVGELILLIFAGTVAFVLCTSILGMAFTKTPVTEFTAAIRTKLVDLIQMIAGAVIGVVSTLLASNKKDKEP
jgi:hypothetical protein